MAVLGGGQGGALSLALTFIVLRTDEAATAAARLSGMAQAVGHLAATGPLAAGAVHQATGTWSLPPATLMLGVCAVATVAGVLAARDRTV
ncbi:hypothetical protein AB0K02_25470 [Streptomyces sp. NPDC049597]|uniref:hypothetical protein n=1 Tax=Streptomyces sp. NPDC049597 TaxID=3155276 RepID=UPI00341FB227